MQSTLKSNLDLAALYFFVCLGKEKILFHFLFDFYYMLWDQWLFYLSSQSRTDFIQSSSVLSYDVWLLLLLSSELHWRDSYFFLRWQLKTWQNATAKALPVLNRDRNYFTYPLGYPHRIMLAFLVTPRPFFLGATAQQIVLQSGFLQLSLWEFCCTCS